MAGIYRTNFIGLYPCNQIIKCHWLCKIVSLKSLTAIAFQSFELFAGFYTLGNHSYTHFPSHCDDTFAHSGILSVGKNAVYKALINFDTLYGKIFQIAEAGVSCPKVVYAGGDTFAF